MVRILNEVVSDFIRFDCNAKVTTTTTMMMMWMMTSKQTQNDQVIAVYVSNAMPI